MFKIGNYTVTDYDAHFHTSGALTVFHSSIMYYVTERKWLSVLVGAATSCAIGLTKEYVIDKNPSIPDIEGNTKGNIYYGGITAASIDMMEKKKIRIDTAYYNNLAPIK